MPKIDISSKKLTFSTRKLAPKVKNQYLVKKSYWTQKHEKLTLNAKNRFLSKKLTFSTRKLAPNGQKSISTNQNLKFSFFDSKTHKKLGYNLSFSEQLAYSALAKGLSQSHKNSLSEWDPWADYQHTSKLHTKPLQKNHTPKLDTHTYNTHKYRLRAHFSIVPVWNLFFFFKEIIWIIRRESQCKAVTQTRFLITI